MSTLLLKLAGPLQSWGVSSRFNVRETRNYPSKSGILGLIAAAEGRRRSDPLEDLLDLQLAVRVDKPGKLVRDFHTAHNRAGRSMPLSHRYYLSDAVFVAGIEGPDGLIEGIKAAVESPVFTLFLGRRSCPPAFPLSLGLRDGPLGDVIEGEPWHAPTWFQQQCRRQQGYRARIIADQGVATRTSGIDTELVQDVPRSFDPANRQYDWRRTTSWTISLLDAPSDRHDPMSLTVGGH